MSDTGHLPLKEHLNSARFTDVAQKTAAVYPAFDVDRFLDLTLPGLDSLSLLQRLRRMTEGFFSTLPDTFPEALSILRKLAPTIGPGFASLMPPDYVGMYGEKHFDLSMEALKFFTPLGTSEFAVRIFLRADQERALRTMEHWSMDLDPHVRRLASEGSRPRLPWSFRMEQLIQDPSPTRKILENLQADPSLYVRKSVANHLNDITKDHPEWVLDILTSWPDDHPHTNWIRKRALRTLIKKGNRRALAAIGAGQSPKVRVSSFSQAPRQICTGEEVRLSLQIESLAGKPQRLVVDYIVHYVKKSGAVSPKVFKWKEFVIPASESVVLEKRHAFRDLSTRSHHPGRHVIDLMINGVTVAQTTLQLLAAHSAKTR